MVVESEEVSAEGFEEDPLFLHSTFVKAEGPNFGLSPLWNYYL